MTASPGLTFSALPTDAEIFRARVFSEPLVPLGRPTRPNENARLAQALRAYATATRPEDVEPITRFLAAHRDSPWRASLLVNLGEVYERTGYARRALDAWNDAWSLTKDATDAYGRAVADRALADWLTLAFARGDVDATRRRLHDVEARQVGGSAETKVRNVRERLSILMHQPHLLVPVEQQALGRLAMYERKSADAATNRKTGAFEQTSTVGLVGRRGQAPPQRRSWASVLRRAARLGLSLRPAVRATRGRLVPRSLVHLKTGNAVAVLDAQADRLLVYDPSLGEDRWIAAAALEDEASGAALLAGPMPDGWEPATAGEAAEITVTAMCPAGPPNDNDPPCPEGGAPPGGSPSSPPSSPSGPSGPPAAPSPPPGPPSDSAGGTEPSSGCGTGSCGTGQYALARYRLHRLTAGLLVEDTPVGHAPPRGPAVFFHVRYNQRAGFFPQVLSFSNLGSKWTHDFLSYVDDLPVSCGGGGAGGDCTPAHARVILRGGGFERHIPSGPTTYVRHWRSRSELVRVSSAPLRFERRLRDGSVEVFGLSDGASPSVGARVFLTEIIDARGQSVQLTYDSQFRLVSIADAIGQVTTLSYELASDPLKITKVTDPFGRFATFTYTSGGQLSSITDVIGLTSSFVYAGDFLASLTTPYGATTFRKETDWQNDAFVRHLEAIDPLGGIERVEYRTELTTLPDSVPASEVPTGFTNFNGALDQFVSLYWDKRAMMVAPRDPASAVITSWLTENLFNHQWLGVNVPRYQKRPLEGRVWYAYPGQDPLTGEVGHWVQPAKVARKMDDGTSQIWETTFNDLGMVTSRTDPLGRRTSYTYAANGIDLLETRQTTGSLNDLRGSKSNYTAQHLAQTITDAAGQSTVVTYNANGQVLTSTNAKNETITYTYDPGGLGYLQSVTGPLAGTTTSQTYDAFGRLRTSTDPDGYTVTIDYDALDRPTRTTFPDGTYTESTYDRLDVVAERDRLGRLTRYTYNAVRQQVAIRDPAGRTTTQTWCACGSLDALTDAKGQQTVWERDLAGRMTREVRADGTTATQFAYEPLGGRLKTVTDAKGQIATYTYALDSALAGVVYTNASTSTPAVSYTYDANYGRMATMVDGVGTTTYTYRPPGTLGAEELATVDGPLPDDTITYTYDELGRLTQRQLNGTANVLEKAYDALGRVTAETNMLGTFGFAYDGVSSRVTSVTYPNGQTTSYAYFPVAQDHRLQTIHHKRADTSTISRFDYTYDAVDNVLTARQQVDSAPAFVWAYEYDRANQLVRAVRQTADVPPTVLARYVYAYDLAGNRTVEQIDDAVTGWTHDALNRMVGQHAGGLLRFAGTVNEPAVVTVGGRPASVDPANGFSASVPTFAGTTTVVVTATDPSGNAATATYQMNQTGPAKTFTWDANGNLTADGTRTFEWDARNQLVAINVGTHRSEFTYDGMQQRVRIVEKDNGVVQSDTKVVWCQQEICEERAPDGTTVTRREMSLGEQVAGSARFFVSDHLGSIESVTDSTGALLARYTFDPWGRRTLTAGSDVTTVGYTQHSWHSSGGVSLTLYRAYEPGVARWLSEDPAGFADGVNRFAYVGNQPTVRIDSLGLQGTSAGSGIYTGTAKGILAAWTSCKHPGDRLVYWKDTPFNPRVVWEEWLKWKGYFIRGCEKNPSPGYSRYSTCSPFVAGFSGGVHGICSCCESCTPK